MSQVAHVEKHFSSSDFVRDIVIGMSDGLTVPFALAAGLSAAAASSSLIVTAGLSEIAAGSIAMGLGGYLAARTDLEHFLLERAREEKETIEIPEVEAAEVAGIFRRYGLDEEAIHTVVTAIRSDRKQWVDFMMKFELGIDTPSPKRARNSAITIALSYVVGGMIPLVPYFFVENISRALLYSIATTLVALFVFGFVKGKFTVARPLKSALQTLSVGALAAAAAFGLAGLVR